MVNISGEFFFLTHEPQRFLIRFCQVDSQHNFFRLINPFFLSAAWNRFGNLSTYRTFCGNRFRTAKESMPFSARPSPASSWVLPSRIWIVRPAWAVMLRCRLHPEKESDMAPETRNLISNLRLTKVSTQTIDHCRT